MSVLAKINFVAQQRVDLHHVLAMESFTAFDFRAMVTSLTGSGGTYVLRGLKVVSQNGLTVGIKVSDAMVMNPLDGNASFYLGLADDADVSIDLTADQTNIFVEGVFSNVTQSPVNLGIWDPLSLSGADASGQEFTASVDTQNIVVLTITANTTGFSEGAIPLFRAATSASDVTNFVDSRNMLFRLGTGGANPDPLNKYSWSSTREESVPNGTGVADAVDSPWRSQDSAGSLNDKAFESFKDWMDAVMTRISEISGQAIWYTSTAAGGGGSGASLQQIFFDTIGHSIQPSKNSAFKWSNVGGNLKLTSEGTIALNGTTSQYHNGLIRWQANNTGLEWELGGSFAVATKRNYTGTSAGLRFESPAVVDGGNIYLFLEREVPKGSGANVVWGNAGTSGFSSSEAVSGSPGDFIGIALGDYIRKESGDFNQYYKVVKSWDGSVIKDNTIAADENTVSDSTIVAFELQSVLDPNTTNITPTSETLRYFRSRYSSDDVVADTVIGANGVLHSFQDSNFYWLGRRDGDLFFLRDYGTMQEGEEATTLDAVYAQGNSGSGDGSFVLEHAKEAVYESGDGYSLKDNASSTLLTVRRRRRDNTVGTPSAGDNSGSLLTYTIDAPVGAMTAGQGLWVRLSDTTSATLTAGSVTNTTDDDQNTDTVTNLYEIRDAADSPTRTFDNIDVFLLARFESVGGVDALVFTDGSILTDFGQLISSNLEVAGEVKLRDYQDTAILYVASDGSKQLNNDTSKLFFDDSGTGLMGIFNLRFELDRIYQGTPADMTILDNLGSHTAIIGTPTSTIQIPGDLIVLGTSFATNVENVQSEDKLISLGVGSLVDSAYGGGIELADDTLSSTQADSTDTFPEITLTFGAAATYSVNDIIGVNAIDDVGGITAGQISGQYVIKASATIPGEAEVVNATTLILYTSGVATATEASTTTPPKVFDAPWSIRLGASDGTYTAGIESWVFRVKGATTAPTITPVNNYGIVPTAHSVDMLLQRIPFVGTDGAGPSPADTTLDFTNNFRWNNSLDTLLVTGEINMTGQIVPSADDTYDLGTGPFRWRRLYLGPGSDSGLIIGTANLYEDGADLLKTDDVFETAEYIKTGRMVQMTETVPLTGPTPLPTGTDLNIFQREGFVYSQNATGTQLLLTNLPGNVYNESVDVTVTIAANATVGMPLDTKLFVSNITGISTDGSTATVTVTVTAHGLITGQFITTYSSTDVGGIVAANLAVTGSSITVTGPDSFTYVAGAVSSSLDTGFLDKVTVVGARSYLVGEDEIEVYLNGVLQKKGVNFDEVGLPQTPSNSIKWLEEVPFQSPVNVITYRIDSNGGQVIINQSGGGSLQSAYNLGPIINIVPGSPVTVSNGGAGKAMVVNGDLDVTGVIDPTGLTFTPQASTPLAGTDTGFWVENNASLDLIFKRNALADVNIVQDFLYRDGSKAMTASLNMGNFNISNLADPTTAQQAVTKNYYDANVVDYLPRDGTLAMQAALSMNSFNIENVLDPTVAQHAATKNWTDTNFLNISGATAMTGNLQLGANKITGLANGTASTDAAAYGQVSAISTSLTNYLLKAGGTMTGNIDFNSSFTGVNVAAPTNPGDIANKGYVDSPDRYTATYITLTNNTGGTVTAGTVITISQSTPGELELADASVLNTAESTVGVVLANILDTASGKVQILGQIAVTATSALLPGKTVYLSETTGEASPSIPATTGTVVFILGYAVSTTEVVLNPQFKTINANIYEEVLEVVAGAPADDNEVTGPITAGTAITLPFDSRDGNSVKQYALGSGQLVVRVDGITKIVNELSATTFSLDESLDVSDKLVIRIEPSDTSFVVSSAISSLQNAYNTGSTINITSGNPVTINGPIGEKLLVINGDIDVTGIIDPIAIQLTRQSSDPLAPGDDGIYIDSNGDMVQSQSGGGTVNITQVAASGIPRKLLSQGTNASPSETLIKGTPVTVDGNGELIPIDISVDSSFGVFGLIDSAIVGSGTGEVATHGRIDDVTMSAIIGDVLYITPTGGIIGTSEFTSGDSPSVGVDGYSSGDRIFAVGVVLKNQANGLKKDIVIAIKTLGIL